jgi:hypothetical protein
MKAKLQLTTTLLLLFLIVSCSDEGDDNPAAPTGGGGIVDTAADTVSYAASIQPIIMATCAASNCHGSAAGQGGLAFGSTSPSHATITSVAGSNGQFVRAGSSATSNFYLKVISNVPNPPGGARMPQGGPFLSTAQQNAVKNWIDQGALDN